MFDAHREEQLSQPIHEITYDFEDSTDLITEYDPAFCQAVIQDGRSGMPIETFSAKFNIDTIRLSEWLSDGEGGIPEFKMACKAAHISCIRYWYKTLTHAIQYRDVDLYNMALKMVQDSMRGTPLTLRENLFRVIEKSTEELKSERETEEARLERIAITGIS
jgi:hypothetical protein